MGDCAGVSGEYNLLTSVLNGYPDIRVPEPWIFTRIRNNIPEYPKIVTILTQLNNSEYMKLCIYCLYSDMHTLNKYKYNVFKQQFII